MNQTFRACQGIISLALLNLSLGCGGDSASPDDSERHVEGLLVSSPFQAGGSSTASTVASRTGSVAYVSIVPGTARKGATMSVRNQNTGATATAPVIDGGLDPVAVAAIADDDLSITVTDSAGHSTTSMETVKQRRPPRVVRTQPMRGSVDVPLNVRVTVVFSGPIDPTTVDSTAIILSQGGKVVAGTPSLSSDGLSLSWTPRSPLAIATSYVVALSPTLEDLNGFAVSGFEPVDFMTGAASEGDYGALEIVVRTSGTPVQVITDPGVSSSGWQLRVGTMPTPFRITPQDTVTVARLPQGRYDLAWSVSPNCTPHSSVPAEVSVSAGVTSHVTAIFNCAAWSALLKATTRSTGVSIPREHQLVFRSQGYVTVIAATVPADGTALIPLPDAATQYQVSVTSSNDQCRTTPSSQEVPLKFTGVTEMTFDIKCGTPSAMDATIEVQTQTSGQAVSSLLWQAFPTSMTLSRAGVERIIDLLPNDVVTLRGYGTLEPLVAGEHMAKWNHLPPNCTGGEEPAPFQVVDGQVVRITLTAACADWAGRLQITAVQTDTAALPYGSSVVFRIEGGGLPRGVIPATYLWAGGSGTVPLPYGEYDISVDPMLSGCYAADGQSQHVSVRGADTALRFNVRCTYAPGDWDW